jgi:hypothetical protein
MSERIDEDGWPIPDKKADAREKLFRRYELKQMGQNLIRTIEMSDEHSHWLKPTEAELAFRNIGKGILRNKARQEPFGAEAVEAVRCALNTPITKQNIREHVERGYLEREPPVRYINFQRSITRSIAEALVRFLECFAKDAELEDYNPIGICAYIKCDKLFIGKRTSKIWCSSICKSAAFNEAKRAEDPKYFSKNAKDHRDNKKKQKDARKKAARQKWLNAKSSKTPF